MEPQPVPLVGVGRPAVLQGSVTVVGVRYDFKSVYVAYIHLIEQLTKALGSSMVVVDGHGLPWSTAARQAVGQYWQRDEADGVTSGNLLHVFPGMRAHAYVRGFDWLVVGDAATPGFINKDPSQLDVQPRIVLFGNEGQPPPLNGGFGARSTLRPNIANRVFNALASFDLVHYGLTVEPGPVTENTFEHPQRDWKIVFPSEVYATGEGYIRVRCVRPHGGEVPHDPRDIS